MAFMFVYIDVIVFGLAFFFVCKIAFTTTIEFDQYIYLYTAQIYGPRFTQECEEV